MQFVVNSVDQKNGKAFIKILKNDGHFLIPHPQISLKQFSNICKNLDYFFYYVGGWKNDQGFLQKKKKFVKLVFFYILQLPHTVI